MAKKLVRKALEMLRKMATEEPEDEEGEVRVDFALDVWILRASGLDF